MENKNIKGRQIADEYDFVVVGGGSSGCAVANRLSEDPNVSVCLLEAGAKDSSVLISMPVGFVAIMRGTTQNWQFETVPQPALNNRTSYQPRGKALGGSSSINGMVCIRGHREDYDRWAREHTAKNIIRFRDITGP